MIKQAEPIKVFISYAPEDEPYLHELEKHLALLEKQGLIDPWHARKVDPGQEWKDVIDDRLEAAQIILILVSSDFIASSYCFDVEMNRAMELHEASAARVIPILLRECDWKTSSFGQLQVLPDGAHPVAKWIDRDDAWSVVARSIRNTIGIASGSPAAPKARIATTGQLVGPLVIELRALLADRERYKADDARTEEFTAKIDELVDRINNRDRPRAGDYVAGTQLIKPLASGTFATVWLAKRETGELAATKIFHREKLAEGLMLWRFGIGLQAMERLGKKRGRDPHIVSLYAVDESQLAFSMPYMREGDLQHIERRAWTLAKKIAVMVKLCGAVEFAHKNNVIHRDIKPANVVLGDDHEPVLTDFDIAEVKYAASLSTSTSGLGTPVFAAPEQHIDSAQATEASDVYSLGRLFYYLLLERSPGIPIERDPSLDNLSSQPSTIVAIVRRATQYDPSKRYPNVAAFRYAIEAHQTGRARVLAMLGRTTRFVRRNAAIVSIVTIVLLGALLVAARERVAAERERASAERERASAELALASAERERNARMAQEKAAADLARLTAQYEAAQEKMNELASSKTILVEEARRVEEKIALVDAQAHATDDEKERELLANERTELLREFDNLNKRLEKLNADVRQIEEALRIAKQEAKKVRQSIIGSNAPAQTPRTSPSQIAPVNMASASPKPAIVPAMSSGSAVALVRPPQQLPQAAEQNVTYGCMCSIVSQQGAYSSVFATGNGSERWCRKYCEDACYQFTSARCTANVLSGKSVVKRHSIGL